jgi:molybdenum cofactor biosynthesis enzyme
MNGNLQSKMMKICHLLPKNTVKFKIKIKEASVKAKVQVLLKTLLKLELNL